MNDRRHDLPLDSTDLVGQAVDSVHAEPIDAEILQAASRRVLQRLSAESAALSGLAPGEHSTSSSSIHGCVGFVSLLPALLSGALTESRRLLVEDHTRECVNCRRELQRLRRGEPVRVAALAAVARPSFGARVASAPRWALAAGVSALLVGGLAAARFLTPGPVDVRVASIQGELLGDDNRALVAGATLHRGDVVRTARDSGAVLELADGSRFELGERSELELGRRRDGVVLDLDRGGMIVEAAKKSGDEKLFVKTGDVLVAVQGTVFSVNHGVKGSRVSVLSGEVNVSPNSTLQAARRSAGANGAGAAGGFAPAVLRSGDQFVSRVDLARVPLDRDVAWSRDAARYRREIAALKVVGHELDQALASPLRTSTRLLDLAPASTAVYLAAPNVGPSLASAWDRLQSQVAQNPAFASWWNRQVGAHEDELEELVTELRELSAGLGGEVVVAVDATAEAPVMLTEVPNPAAFSPILDEKIARFNERVAADGSDDHPVLRRITAAPVGAGRSNEVLVWLRGDLLLLSSEPQLLRAVDAAADGTNPFVGTAFHQRIAALYGEGAGWLGAIDAQRFREEGERRLAERTDDAAAVERHRAELRSTGFSDLDAVVFNMATGEAGQGGSTRALISFAGERRGMASWLAAPAPSGALEFVSPEAHFAVAALLKRPAAMFDDLLTTIDASGGDHEKQLEKFERSHVAVREDLAAALGGDVAFALDGPWLPQPTWKLIVEVVDEARLQSTLERLVAEWNAQVNSSSGDEPGHRLVLTQEAAGSRPVYRLEVVPVAGGAPRMTVFYLYEDGYLVAGPNRALLLESITQRRAGITLASTNRFTDLLPTDGQVHFSAVAYQDLGAVSGLVGQWLGAASEMNADQRREIESLARGTASLMVAYGQDDAIEVAGRTSDGPFGLGFQKLLGLAGAFGKVRAEATGAPTEETSAAPAEQRNKIRVAA
jgi:hypothetical protein